MRPLDAFEAIARATVAPPRGAVTEEQFHPFDVRNIHPAFPKKVRQLFDDGYYQEAAFAAFTFIDKTVMRRSKKNETGYKLMMNVFNEEAPAIRFNDLATVSEKDEQRGFKHLFAGAMAGIRNPRGHDDINDDPDACLDFLAFASMLMRKLETGVDVVSRVAS